MDWTTFTNGSIAPGWILSPGRELFIVVGQDFDATPGDLRVQRTRPVAKLRWTFRF